MLLRVVEDQGRFEYLLIEMPEPGTSLLPSVRSTGMESALVVSQEVWMQNVRVTVLGVRGDYLGEMDLCLEESIAHETDRAANYNRGEYDQ